jgi:protein-S-isoprenylcysteine O-methyltransferase Ste14
MGALIFVPAGTLHYWQGWAFLAVFLGSSCAIGIYLAIYDPVLLERRLRAGPMAEKEPMQKLIIFFAIVGFIALIVGPTLAYRFHITTVSAPLSIVGDALILLGFAITFVVLLQNSYAASTIQVAEGQTVVSTGLYAYVRHPMYGGVLPLLAGIPLALGSWVGLLGLFLIVPALAWRLLHEEQFLHKNLQGYTQYTHNVRYRLVPYVW